MRNEALIGYLLHQRPYQEKRALYYLFLSNMVLSMVLAKKVRRFLCLCNCLPAVNAI